MGAAHVINYKKETNWGLVVKSLTRDRAGVDQVIEVGGAATLSQSVTAIKPEGLINVVGAVGGEGSSTIPTILDCWLGGYTARGVAVGSRKQMEEMVAAVEANHIRPVVDAKVFSLDKAKEAFAYYVSLELNISFDQILYIILTSDTCSLGQSKEFG